MANPVMVSQIPGFEQGVAEISAMRSQGGRWRVVFKLTRQWSREHRGSQSAYIVGEGADHASAMESAVVAFYDADAFSQSVLPIE
jgi:hypothetical protein